MADLVPKEFREWVVSEMQGDHLPYLIREIEARRGSALSCAVAKGDTEYHKGQLDALVSVLNYIESISKPSTVEDTSTPR